MSPPFSARVRATQLNDPQPLARFSNLVSRLGFEDWAFVVGHDGNYYLRIECIDGTCNTTGDPLPWKGRKWRLSPFMTDGEVVWTAFKAVITALEHEAREKFTFDGVAVADSHVDIHALVEFIKTTPRAERPHGPPQ